MTMRACLVGLGLSVLLVGACGADVGGAGTAASAAAGRRAAGAGAGHRVPARLDAAAQQLESDPQAATEVAGSSWPSNRPSCARRGRSPPPSGPIHSRLFILRARAHVQAMNNEKAGESFRELLRVDPFFTGTLSPREQELLDAIRTKDSGLLEVSSSVPSCKVLLDGVEIGVTGDTPVRASVVYGTYEVRLEKPGFRGAGTRVQVVTGQTAAVTDLAPKAQVPPMAFLTDRDGVEVSVDNVHAGDTVRIADFRKQLSAEENIALDQAIAQARFDPATSAGFLLRDPPVDRSVILRFGGKCLIEESRTVAVTAEALARLDTSDGAALVRRPERPPHAPRRRHAARDLRARRRRRVPRRRARRTFAVRAASLYRRAQGPDSSPDRLVHDQHGDRAREDRGHRRDPQAGARVPGRRGDRPGHDCATRRS